MLKGVVALVSLSANAVPTKKKTKKTLCYLKTYFLIYVMFS